MRSTNQLRRMHWRAAATSGLCLALVSIAPVSASHAAPITKSATLTRDPASALDSAKTISFTETVSQPGPGGKMIPVERMDIRIARPNKVMIDLRRIPESGATGEQAQSVKYVSDGKTQYIYSATEKQYLKADAPEAGTQPDGAFGGIYSQARLNLIMHGDHLPSATWTSSHATAQIGGKPARAYVSAIHATAMDGTPVTLTQKLWIDSKTRLPVQLDNYITHKGVTKLVIETRFSGWAINQPIADRQFAFVPPADAKEYVQPKLLAVGTQAPDFAATTPDGKTVHLSDYRGKPVVVDFWATWCGPCQQSMPHLNSVYNQVKDKGVAVLAVCVWDDRSAFDQWVKDNIGTKYSFPVAFDPAARDGDNSIATKLYGVDSIPTQYVIDKDGKVAATNVGYGGPGDKQLESELQKQGVKVAYL